MLKPVGWTSFDVVKKVRNITKFKKVGHGGTLDPFASGILIIGTENDTKNLTSKEEGEQIKHIDNLTYKTFVTKFNEKYADLPKEQKELLTVYIASFADNSLELKHHLNEQVGDLRQALENEKNNAVFENEQMKEKYDDLIVKLDSYKNEEIDINMVSEVLKNTGSRKGIARCQLRSQLSEVKKTKKS